MILVPQQTILLVSDDRELWAAVRREFAGKDGAPRVTTVRTLEAARRIMEDAAPTVILLEERAVTAEGEGQGGNMRRLSSVVSALAVHAPVLVIGPAEQQSELAALVADGAADFVAQGGQCLTLTLKIVEQRLEDARQAARKAQE